jgi:hypothetical protein
MEKYQTIGRRFVALIIDAFVMIPVSFANEISARQSRAVSKERWLT